MIAGCAGCTKPITGKFLVTVLERNWHAECVRCSDCACSLTDKCFSREGKLFCRTDFFRRFGTKCSGCLQGISPQDLVRKARDRVFHLKCFTCCVCRKQLSTGEELYVLDENKFVCKEDFIRGKAHGDNDMMSDEEYDMDSLEPGDGRLIISPCSDRTGSESGRIGSDNPITPMTPATPKTPTPLLSNTQTDIDKVHIKEEGEDSDGELDGEKGLDDKDKGDDDKGGNKRRGPRTTIKAKQLEVLKNSFNKTPKPTRHIREQLAKETGLPMRVIQVWFQNKRSKERRMKQLTSMGMRAHLFANPRKLRDLPLGMEDAYAFFPGYNGFPGQQFPYFGPQHGLYPPMGPAMEQPLPPGGPMGGPDFPPLSQMGMLSSEGFGQHHPLHVSPPEDMSLHGGPGNFNDHTNSEVMAW